MLNGYTFKRGLAFLLLAALRLLFFECAGAGAEAEKERRWLIPDHARLQFAGNMGLFSVGLGYSLFHEKLESDLFYGYAPARNCGVPVHHITQKNTLLPAAISTPWLRWTPVTAGVHFLLKAGNNSRGTWLVLPGRYPERYYSPTSFHVLLTAGTILDITGPGFLRHTGVYFEAGTTALYLRDWLRADYVRLSDIVSFDIGMTRRF
ncbi:MAG: hypothetical protein ACYC9O_05880 [Candidatus Latescibacterota bacterium]